jgi:hypothetical protein
MIASISVVEQMFRDFLESNGHPLDESINYDSSKFHYLRHPPFSELLKSTTAENNKFLRCTNQ